jgi:LysR family transcriptional regulator, transcriptional activator of nhaA
MEWLNYHHLLYFWTIVRAGSIQKAGAELKVSPPAISTQIKVLEDQLGEKLFARSGRQLVLTDTGKTVFSYAEDIFTLGRELMDVVKNRPVGRPLRLDIGIVDVLPKMVAHWLIEPALQLREPVKIICREAALDQLLLRLATLELDVVLSDAPIHPTAKIRAYNHLLGECAVAFVATTDVAEGLHRQFPKSLDGSPMLLPTDNTNFRRSLDSWFESEGIRPDVIGEFEDYALLRTFGHAGAGVFPVPTIFEKQLRREDSLKRIGSTDKVRTSFYAISGERKIEHPAVVAMCDTARRQLFGAGKSHSKLPVTLGGARSRA